MTNHLRLDLDLVELLAGVDADDAANHLGDDNHVSEVGLDEVGLLVGLGLLLGLSELLDEAHGTALQAAVDPAAGAGVDDIAELVGAKVQKAVGGLVFLFSVVFGFIVGWTSAGCISVNSLVGNVLVEVDSSVAELAERSSLLELGGLLGVLNHCTRSVSQL